MKKIGVLFLMIFTMTLVNAAACDLSVSLLNQDPYPAVPGDYVKIVFQVKGLDNPECGDVTFNLLQDYPLVFDPTEKSTRTFQKVDYIKDYESNLLIPYKVRIDENALDGTNPIEVSIQNRANPPISETFDLEVKDVRADFEVYVKNYNYQTHELELEILNIAKSDVEALSVEILKQENIEVKGPNRIIVGDLDSNEYTTADFEATPSEGEIKLLLTYSDTINTRRTIEKIVTFDSTYFTNRVADQSSTGIGTYILWGAVILLVGWWIVGKFTKKKKR